MATFDWPAGLPYKARLNQMGATIGGGRSIGGAEQVVVSPSHRWFASIEVPLLGRRDRILAFRALKAKLKGRANLVRIGPRDKYFAPWGTDAYGRLRVPALFRHPELDGTPYADNVSSLTSGLIVATVAANAAINATSIQITVATGGALEPGQYFSLASGDRLHMIADITNVAGSTYTCTIWPWLRAAVSSEASVNLTRPTCAMRMTDDGGGWEDFGPVVAMEFEEVP